MQLTQSRPRDARIPSAGNTLHGDLVVYPGAAGVVLFAHGSGSSRHSSRNRFVAGALQQAGLATLLFDLLTETEEERDRYTGQHRFDIPLLAERLVDATEWLAQEGDLSGLPVGYFGASTGSAAALIAAEKLRDRIRAVVSRGGRPDLADAALPSVKAPTLLIVGGADGDVIDLNEQAYARLTCEKKLTIVPRASHLFEEPGALEAVAEAASGWFREHLERTRPHGAA
jgi:pimeloyl-ACP methyl ester carboxylesterase